MGVFGEYADYYDLFYREKDYEGECDFLEAVFADLSGREVRSVLDLGCGTGGHCIPLSRRGYRVVGVDRSGKMLRRARDKARDISRGPRFECADIGELRLGEGFDAVVSLFNVAGYQKQSDQVHRMFETAGIHLNPEGVLVFDFWFAPSVMADRPHCRLKEVVSGDLSILRFADPVLRVEANRVDIDYRVLCLDKDRVAADIRERHEVRFFSLPEIEEFLRPHGLEVIRFCKWLQPESPPEEPHWNACAVARRA